MATQIPSPTPRAVPTSVCAHPHVHPIPWATLFPSSAMPMAGRRSPTKEKGLDITNTSRSGKPRASSRGWGVGHWMRLPVGCPSAGLRGAQTRRPELLRSKRRSPPPPDPGEAPQPVQKGGLCSRKGRAARRPAARVRAPSALSPGPTGPAHRAARSPSGSSGATAQRL